MNQKTFLGITGVLFLLMTILHVARIIFGWNAIIGGWVIPLWVSWIAIVLAGFLSFQSWKLMKK